MLQGAIILGGLIVLWKWFAAKNKADFYREVDPQGQADVNFAFRTAGGYKSKSKFFAMINLASAEFGVPSSIIEGVLWVESADGDNTTGATSGEVGIMQIIPATASYIRTLSPSLSGAQPHIPSNAIRMGAALLKDNYKRLNSWPKAIIAYNSGVNNHDRVNNPNDWYLVRVENRLKVLYANS